MIFLTLLAISRIYWPTDLAQYAVKDTTHTHIQIEGYVTYKIVEGDGDIHCRVCNSPNVKTMDAKQCVVCEIIPKMSMPAPKVGDHVRVLGIARTDNKHMWKEIHPIESWTLLN